MEVKANKERSINGTRMSNSKTMKTATSEQRFYDSDRCFGWLLA